MDINFAPDGTLHVVELDEGSWLAVELGAGAGGTVNACSWPTFSCVEEGTDLTIPMAVAIRGERVFAWWRR